MNVKFHFERNGLSRKAIHTVFDGKGGLKHHYIQDVVEACGIQAVFNMEPYVNEWLSAYVAGAPKITGTGLQLVNGHPRLVFHTEGPLGKWTYTANMVEGLGFTTS